MKYAFILVFIIMGSSLSAQFNIKVGYNGGYSNMKQTADVFDLYNAQFSTIGKKLKPVKFFNGLELGARYKFAEYFAIDAGMSSTTGDNKGEGIQISPDESITNEYKLSLTNYYVGLETYFGHFGLGGNIGYQKLKYRNSINDGDKQDIMSQSVPNSRFYIIIEAPSDNMSFSLRPYVSVNWQPYNIQPVERSLFPSSTRPLTDFDQDVFVFGISLLFFNGPQ